MNTQFASVYNRFLGKITDDMYIELTPQDTLRDLQQLLIDAIPGFEFPRISLNYTISQTKVDKEAAADLGFIVEEFDSQVLIDNSCFNADLTDEEINILALLMMQNWLQRQVTSIENIRMKYSGADFKMTSQANHLAKLLALQEEVRRQCHHMQRLYKRRKINEEGKIVSTWSEFKRVNSYDN